jgi:polyhydroxyalkanoate synthesis regulator phasin
MLSEYEPEKIDIQKERIDTLERRVKRLEEILLKLIIGLGNALKD